MDLLDTSEKWANHLALNNSGIKHGQASEYYTENIHAYYGKNLMCGIMDAVISWYRVISLKRTVYKADNGQSIPHQLNGFP